MQRHDRCRGVRRNGADRKRLAAALETAREARVYRRVEALLLVAEGQSVAEAARRCHVDRSSVHRWLGQYGARRDATALADRPRPGRPRQSSRLTRDGWLQCWHVTLAVAATGPRAGRCRCWRTT